MANPELTKDVEKLGENISSFTNGEARIIDFDTKEPSVKVELYFKTGFHKGGTFIFQVFIKKIGHKVFYPDGRHAVVFLTRILHPAVDDVGNLELADGGCGRLEDIVRDVYHLIKNPDFQSISNTLFYEDLDIKDQSALRAKFAEDVRMSFRVDEILAEMNALGKSTVKPE